MIDELQTWAVYLLLSGFFYVSVAYLFRSLHSTGILTWQARRFRAGGTALIVLIFAAAEVKFNVDRHRIGIVLAGAILVVIFSLAFMLARWWWHDRQNEAAAREAWLQRVQEEGVPTVAPTMSRGKRVWNWSVTAYALFLVIAGLYAFVHWLVTK